MINRFAKRYYAWSLERSREELRSGFPLLSLVLGSHTFKFLEFVQDLQPEQRDKFCTAMVKRFHPQAVSIGAANVSAEEEQLVTLYLERGHAKGPAGERIMLPFGSERERLLRENLESGKARQPRRSAVKKLVARALSDLVPPSKSPAAGEMIFETGVADWTMRTYIDFGHTWNSMISYSHVLIPNAQTPLPNQIHICGWMGIAGQTQWDLYTEDETQQVSDGIVTLVRWFYGRWHELIQF